MANCELLGDFGGIQLFSDGRIVRPQWPDPDCPADPSFEKGEFGCKDVILDEGTGMWARIFAPKSATVIDDASFTGKRALLVYFHAGGFASTSPASMRSHSICSGISRKMGMIVVSVAYRLAPEHRLPVAFDDSFASLQWLQSQAQQSPMDRDPWLKNADFSRIFLMGNSSGGTIVHYMAARSIHRDLSPLGIKGLVSVAPFFGGEERSKSEIQSLVQPDLLTLAHCDTLWRFCLPEGANRDHGYCRVPRAEEIAKIDPMPPLLVVVGAGDVLYSRVVEYYEELRKAGKDAKLVEYPDRGHFVLFPEVEGEMEYSYGEMIQFMNKCSSL
ncbi:probable carboxylesterase 8 [Selaginella moellendorffii]|nr:probable carboxylesterase 8 [Selaginella moellendorffii]|eukprot:XP_002994010.2 probable carboxylesterase 8 [Selaginella moellendorffii]